MNTMLRSKYICSCKLKKGNNNKKVTTAVLEQQTSMPSTTTVTSMCDERLVWSDAPPFKFKELPSPHLDSDRQRKFSV
jgi:hypothetical protein